MICPEERGTLYGQVEQTKMELFGHQIRCFAWQTPQTHHPAGMERLVKVEGEMKAARYWEILEDNQFLSAGDIQLQRARKDKAKDPQKRFEEQKGGCSGVAKSRIYGLEKGGSPCNRTEFEQFFKE